MTVKELYEELKKEIDKGHGDIPAMIRKYDKNWGYCGGYVMIELDAITYYKKNTHWSEHLELGRY